MEFIIADQDRMELGMLSAAASLDIDLSRDAENAEGTNDGQMTVTADEGIEYGIYIFSPGSEFGGRILDLKRSTASVSYTHLDVYKRQILYRTRDGHAEVKGVRIKGDGVAQIGDTIMFDGRRISVERR